MTCLSGIARLLGDCVGRIGQRDGVTVRAFGWRGWISFIAKDRENRGFSSSRWPQGVDGYKKSTDAITSLFILALLSTFYESTRLQSRIE